MSYGFWPCIHYQVFKKSHASHSIQIPLQLQCTIGQIIRQVKMHKQLLCLGIFVTFCDKWPAFYLAKKFFCPWFMLHLTLGSLTGASAYCCHGGTNFFFEHNVKTWKCRSYYPFANNTFWRLLTHSWQLDKLLPQKPLICKTRTLFLVLQLQSYLF